MAIRFRCRSCAQPIEIDDEWASKMVACPYCHNTVTAPSESTLEDIREIPTASPLTPDGAATPHAPPPLYQTAAPGSHPNRIAGVAMVLACCSVGFLVLTYVLLAPHKLVLEDLTSRMSQAASFAEVMEAQREFYEKYPDAMRWMVPVFMLEIGGGLTSLIAIVCGIVALRRPQRRGMAVAALVIAGLVPLIFCCGGAALGPFG